MKKIINICFLILILFNFVSIFYNISFAKDPRIDTLITDARGATEAMDPGNDGVFQGINKIIGLIQIAGTGIAIVTVSMLGIKYMLASPGEKAETKKQILPIIIGCVLVFGGVNVVAIIAKFVTESTK